MVKKAEETEIITFSFHFANTRSIFLRRFARNDAKKVCMMKNIDCLVISFIAISGLLRHYIPCNIGLFHYCTLAMTEADLHNERCRVLSFFVITGLLRRKRLAMTQRERIAPLTSSARNGGGIGAMTKEGACLFMKECKKAEYGLDYCTVLL
ncbi:MAG: hypothetical protein LBP54_04125 [Campylobacteraceae bacterium]|jgi:hypothetical protein|nr:hypothetical protein [Campylobacteraceae bacterium]